MKPTPFVILAVAAVLLTGCARSTIESRRAERLPAYQSLSAEQRALVDQGQVRVGMSQDAVYIAWGEPRQRTQSEDGQGLSETWLYHDSTLDTHHYWTFRERWDPRGGRVYLDRVLETDSRIRDYVSAEITFREGLVRSWRTLPTPPATREGFRPFYP